MTIASIFFLYIPIVSSNRQSKTNIFQDEEINKVDIVSPNKIFFIYTVKNRTFVIMFKESSYLSTVLGVLIFEVIFEFFSFNN